MSYSANDTLQPQQHLDIAPARVEHHPYEWWERFLFVPPAMSAVGAVLTTLVPTNPPIAIVVFIWALLLFVSVCASFFLMRGELTLSRYQTTTWQSDGTPIVKWRRRYFIPAQVLTIGLLLLTLLTVYSLLIPSDATIHFRVSIFVVDFALTLIIALIRWLDRAGWESRFETLFGRFRLLIAFAILAFVMLSLDWSFVDATPAGQAAPWQSQLQFVQQEADRIASGSTLTAVTAGPPVYKLEAYSPDRPLDVGFYFRSTSGADLAVHILDSNPPRLLSVSPPSSYSKAFSDSDKQKYVAEFSKIEVSPRQIYQQTLPQAEQLNHGQPIRSGFDIDAEPSDETKQYYGMPLVWTANYGEEYFFVLDPSTGKVFCIRNLVDNSDCTPPLQAPK